jgi:hypothetical protein
MKKQLVLILTLFCLCGMCQLVSAYGGPPPPPPGHHNHHPGSRMRARRVLDETRDYLYRARRLAYGSERVRLDRAFSRQSRARNYYSQGFYERAISSSLQARETAQNIIANHQRRPGPPPHHGPVHGGSSINIRLNL